MSQTKRESPPHPASDVAQGIHARTGVEVLGLSREYSFETGIVQNLLVLRPIDGQVVRVEIPELCARDIIQSFSGWKEPPTSRRAAEPRSAQRDLRASELFTSAPEVAMPMDREYSPALVPDEDRVVFGAAGAALSVMEAPAEPRSERPRRREELTRERPPVVDMDEYGNPILKGPGYVDVNSFLGGDSPDEDGVGQL